MGYVGRCCAAMAWIRPWNGKGGTRAGAARWRSETRQHEVHFMAAVKSAMETLEVLEALEALEAEALRLRSSSQSQSAARH